MNIFSRREEKESKNIDLLMAHPKYHHQDDNYATKVLENLREKLEEKKYLVDVIGAGAHQIIGIVKLPVLMKRKKNIEKKK